MKSAVSILETCSVTNLAIVQNPEWIKYPDAHEKYIEIRAGITPDGTGILMTHYKNSMDASDFTFVTEIIEKIHKEEMIPKKHIRILNYEQFRNVKPGFRLKYMESIQKIDRTYQVILRRMLILLSQSICTTFARKLPYCLHP